jgi:hypothetical protein
MCQLDSTRTAPPQHEAAAGVAGVRHGDGRGLDALAPADHLVQVHHAAVQVAFGKHSLKPVFHFTGGSRVEAKRFQAPP